MTAHVHAFATVTGERLTRGRCACGWWVHRKIDRRARRLGPWRPYRNGKLPRRGRRAQPKVRPEACGTGRWIPRMRGADVGPCRGCGRSWCLDPECRSAA